MNDKTKETTEWILKKFNNPANGNYQMASKLDQEGVYTFVEIRKALAFMEQESFMYYSGNDKDSFQLTDHGLYAAELGLKEYYVEIGDKKKMEEKMAEMKQKKDISDFRNSRFQVFRSWLTPIIALAAFFLSLYNFCKAH